MAEDEPALRARLEFLQREYDALHSQLRAVNYVAPVVAVAGLLGGYWSFWIAVAGISLGASIWLATHYIGRTHVLETEERINDTRAHMGLAPTVFKR